MQTKKKALTTMIVAMLAFAMVVALIQPASANPVKIVAVYEAGTTTSISSGPVGTEVDIVGSDATPGGKVELYWDAVKAENKLAEKYAKGDGTFTFATIAVPEGVAGIHYFIVYDVLAMSFDKATFTITSKLKLDPNKGVPGDTITATGTGFGESVYVALLFWNDTAPLTGTAADEEIGTGDGTTKTFAGTLLKRPVRPYSVTITATVGGFVVTIKDDGKGALKDTGVTGSINYVTGAWSLTFTTAPDATTKIKATYDYYKPSTKPALYIVHPTGLKSGAKGSFTTTFKVPSVSADLTYKVRALDAIGNVPPTDPTFEVGMYIVVKPTKGPPDTVVTVKGKLSASSTVTVKFGYGTFWITVLTDVPTDTTGYFEKTFKVPMVPWGDYKVRATDAKDITREADFTVAPAPSISLSPTSGLPGDEVAVTGEHFTEDADLTLYFGTIMLETLTTDGVGAFSTTFIVPEVAKGSYKVKAVDEEGLTAEATFRVVEFFIIIRPRAGPYMRGETISFYINSTVELDSIELSIEDAEGYPFWDITWELGKQIFEVEGFWVVPYYRQLDEYNNTLTLPSDAVLGKWTWTATATYGVKEEEVSGTFTVTALPYAEMLAKLTALDASLVAIKDGVATIQTSVGTIEGSVTALSADVVAIKTDIGTITGKITAIEGSVATIKTDIGTVKADVSAIKGYFPIVVPMPDLTPMWAAVVLSLIAAVAAVIAVIQITRKIAG